MKNVKRLERPILIVFCAGYLLWQWVGLPVLWWLR